MNKSSLDFHFLEAIFKFHGNSSSDTKYRNKIRSRYSNLKDAKNPDLRDSVMTGVISPDKLASMKPEEMASKQLQELRKKFTKEAINDHQMAQNQGTETDMFTCGKERFIIFLKTWRKIRFKDQNIAQYFLRIPRFKIIDEY